MKTWLCVALLLGLFGCRPTTAQRDGAVGARDAATVDAGRSHVCYGAAGSAVELPREMPCEAVGASETRPAGPSSVPSRPFPVARDAGRVEMF